MGPSDACAKRSCELISMQPIDEVEKIQKNVSLVTVRDGFDRATKGVEKWPSRLYSLRKGQAKRLDSGLEVYVHLYKSEY